MTHIARTQAIWFAQALLAMIAAARADTTSDPQMVFNNSCRTCHSMKEGDNRLGPSLAGVVGRKAGHAVRLPVLLVDAELRHRLGRGDTR